MVSVEAEPSNCSRHFEQSFCVSEENLCVNCFNMKDHIQVLTTELKSAQLIIKILQDELKSKVSEPMNTENLPRCVNFNSQAKNNSESGSESESEWIEFRRNNHKTKLLKKTSRCLKQLT
jgi:HD superfamily phosphohydrolase